MTASLASILFALCSFIVTFTVARALAKWFKKRKAERERAQLLASQSRQVRRARERKKE